MTQIKSHDSKFQIDTYFPVAFLPYTRSFPAFRAKHGV